MRSVLEQIPKKKGSSFRLLINPKLHDFYYWHFHPELELVFIDGVDGSRQVGSHSGKYLGSDMALIGSYIPHLNFDYGVKGEYNKIVLQIDPNFLQLYSGSTPELTKILQLFDYSRHGIVFQNETKNAASILMGHLEGLEGFPLFTKVLEIFHVLASAKDFELLHDRPYKNEYYEKQQDKIQEVIRFIKNNFQHKINLKELAKISNYSEAAFCRYFKKMTKLNFTTFLNNYRIEMAKQYLNEGANVSETAFSTGFESLSYFNRVFKKTTGIGPLQYRNQQKS